MNRRIVDRLAILLPDGSREVLPHATVVKCGLRAGMKTPFSGNPITMYGNMEIRFAEEKNDWIEVKHQDSS